MNKILNNILTVSVLSIAILILANNSILPQTDKDWYWIDSWGNKGTMEELDKILYAHQLWLNSNKRKGGHADLKNTVLNNADLTGYDLRKIDFSNSKLKNVKFINAKIGATNFENCDLSYANFSDATTDFDEVNTRTDFSNAQLVGTDFSDANLTGAIFSLIKFDNTDFKGAIIDRTVLFGTDFTYAVNLMRIKSSELVHIDSNTKGPINFTFDSFTSRYNPLEINELEKPISEESNSTRFLNLIGDLVPFLIAAFSLFIIFNLVIAFVKQKKTLNKDETEISNKIQTLEAGAEEKKSLQDFIETILTAASEKQRLTMLKSEVRSNWLYRIGTSLMTFTIAIPFITVYIYFQDSQIARDWHILAAGVSFSLIFLAAARGLMNQHSTQREIYFLLSERVFHYSDLINGLKIAKKFDSDNNSTLSLESVKIIVTNLLINNERRSQFKTNFTDEDESKNSIFSFIKELIERK